MRLGIYTKYCHCEPTLAALRLANWAESEGASVSLLTPTTQLPQVSDRWDSLCKRTSDVKFTKWAKRQSLIVWTHTPAQQQLTWAKKQGIRTAVIPFWHSLKSGQHQLYQLADHIVCPTTSCGYVLRRRWGFRSILIAPWDTNLPLMKKPPHRQAERPRVLFPLIDRSPNQMETTLVQVIKKILEKSEAAVRVAYLPSQVRPAVLRQLDEMQNEFSGRLTFIPSPTPSSRPFIFHSCDITVWPVHFANIGVVALQSLAMGTPVVAFKVAPLTEFLTVENSVLIDTLMNRTAFGLPVADPDYQHLVDAVLDLVRYPDVRQTLEAETHTVIRERAKEFAATWRMVFSPQGSKF